MLATRRLFAGYYTIQKMEKLQSKKGKPVAGHGRSWQSVLNPYIAEIWNWRSAAKPYREIRALLAEQGVHVATSTIERFVNARKRRAEKIALPGLPGGAAQPLSPTNTAPGLPTPAPTPPAPPASLTAAPALSDSAPRRGMLPPQHSKHHDSTGKPVEPPPDPNKFRSENL
jgi:hypothetical protein